MLTQLYVCGRFLLAYRVFAVVGEAALHAQAVNGAISETVTDPAGAAIAGATVAPENGVRVSVTGFQNSVPTGVPVVAGSERVVDMAMKMGQAQETVSAQRQASSAPCVPAIKPSAPAFYCAERDYSVAGARPLQSEAAVENTVGRLPSGTVVTAGLKSLTACQLTRTPRCHRKPQLPSVRIRSDRAFRRDVFGVA